MGTRPDNMQRQRSTWRVSNANYDFIHTEAMRLGLSLNGTLNVLLAELKAIRCHNDSIVTATLANQKQVQ